MRLSDNDIKTTIVIVAFIISLRVVALFSLTFAVYTVLLLLAIIVIGIVIRIVNPQLIKAKYQFKQLTQVTPRIQIYSFVRAIARLLF